jgi:hypothetical protein
MQDREYAARLVNTLIDNVRRGETGATAYRDLIIDELDRGMAAQDRERAKTPEPVSMASGLTPEQENKLDDFLLKLKSGKLETWDIISIRYRVLEAIGHTPNTSRLDLEHERNSGYFYEAVLRYPRFLTLEQAKDCIENWTGFTACHVKQGTTWRSGDGNGLERLVK